MRNRIAAAIIFAMLMVGIVSAQQANPKRDSIVAQIEALEKQLEKLRLADESELKDRNRLKPDPEPELEPKPESEPESKPESKNLPLAEEILPTVGHHKFPDFTTVADTVVGDGSVQELSGDHGIIAVHGKALIRGDIVFQTLMVYPGGVLTLEPGAHLVVKDIPINYYHDPRQWGNGLIILGRIYANGKEVQPMAKCSGELSSGDTRIEFTESLSNWKKGDVLGVADSRAYATNTTWRKKDALPGEYSIEGSKSPQILARWRELRTDEEVNIKEVGDTWIELEEPLKYRHPGARNAHGELVATPYVCNTSREILIESENPVGVRGHIVISEHAYCELVGVEMRNMGRTEESGFDADFIHPHRKRGLDSTKFDADGNVTAIGMNQPGKYAFHFHHCHGPMMGKLDGEEIPYQFQVRNCSVNHATKWSYVVHGTSHGLVDSCVAWGGQEAGFVTEDGNEAYNLFNGNFAGARFRIGIWMNGPMNRVENNVVGSCQDIGMWWTADGLHMFPTARGQMHGQGVLYGSKYTSALSNKGNETYSCRKSHTFSSVGTSTMGLKRQTADAVYGAHDKGHNLSGRNLMEGCKMWHAHTGSVMYLNFAVDFKDCEVYEAMSGVSFAGTAEGNLENVTIHQCGKPLFLRGRAEASRFLMKGGSIHCNESSTRTSLIRYAYMSQNPRYGDAVYWFKDVELLGRSDDNPSIALSTGPQTKNQTELFFINGHQLFNVKQLPDYVITDKDMMKDDIGKTNQQIVDEGRLPWMGDMVDCENPGQSLPSPSGPILTNGVVCSISEEEIRERWEFTSAGNSPSKIEP